MSQQQRLKELGEEVSEDEDEDEEGDDEEEDADWKVAMIPIEYI